MEDFQKFGVCTICMQDPQFCLEYLRLTVLAVTSLCYVFVQSIHLGGRRPADLSLAMLFSVRLCSPLGCGLGIFIRSSNHFVFCWTFSCSNHLAMMTSVCLCSLLSRRPADLGLVTIFSSTSHFQVFVVFLVAGLVDLCLPTTVHLGLVTI